VAYPEIFRGRGFETFLYGLENLVVVCDFFLKKPLQIEKKSQKGGLEPLPEYAPETNQLTFDHFDQGRRWQYFLQ